MNTLQSILPAALAATLLFASCSSNDTEQHAFSSEPVMVTLANATGNGNSNTIAASGQVEAVQSAMISTRMMGVITNINVNIGDHVTKGQVLFTIHAADIQAKGGQVAASIAQAEAALANAKKDFDRFTALYKQNSATAKELDNVTLQYKAAQAQLDAARQMRNEVNANMEYARVTAPFSGVITQKMMDAGNMASPGMPVLAMEQPGDLQVTTTVSETEIGNIQTGNIATIHVSAAGKDIQGKVARISRSSVTSGGQYVVKLSIAQADAKDVLSGMYATVNFQSVLPAPGNSGEITVPAKALVHQNELTGIYTVSSANTALLRWVRTGKTYGDRVAILSGLDATEQFITQADSRLYNGAPVKVH